MTAQPEFRRVDLPENAQVDRAIHRVGFAAGSGITPVLSLMKSILAREPKSRFVLVDGNRSTQDIAGVLSANRRVLGLMPHPERAIEPALGSADGRPLFTSLVEALA